MVNSRKWMILVAVIWIQAFTGTNFDFSAYSSDMKSILGMSQVQLNYLATASDLGKAVGWSSGVALMYLPLWAVMFAAVFMGLVGYGGQWLLITNLITLPYFVVFLLCLLAGCSICWFNTVCFVLCIKNFPSSMPLALSLTVSFNGLSAALYNLAATSLDPSSSTVYLLLNALLPLLTSVVTLIPVLRQSLMDSPDADVVNRDQLTFRNLYVLAIITGLYLLFVHPSDSLMARLLLSGAIFLMIIPLGIPGILYESRWFNRTFYSSINGSGFLVDTDNVELNKQLLSHESSIENELGNSTNGFEENIGFEADCWCNKLVTQGQLVKLGQEHKAGELIRRLDFWLYYVAYFCGGTLGLVYSNNLGQISESLGHGYLTYELITIYSSFSFFGRLLSAAPDFIQTKACFSRTGWLSIALIPTPIAFALLTVLGANCQAIQAGTALIGLSSGFVFAAAVSVTSELFGPGSVGVNHNILITNIPIGSLVYGFVAAMVYDNNATPGLGIVGETLVCMGRKCYSSTFVWWCCISVLGLASSTLLFLRTRPAYWRSKQSRKPTVLS